LIMGCGWLRLGPGFKVAACGGEPSMDIT